MPTFYDRFNLAGAALTKGEPQEALNAIFNPDTLPPRLRQTLGEEWGSNTFTKTLIDVASNPLFLGGLLASIYFPIAKGGAVVKLRDSVKNGVMQLGPVRRFLGTSRSLFAGTGIPGLISGAGRETEAFKTAFAGRGQSIVEEYLEKTGNRSVPTATQYRVSAWLDGLHDVTQTKQNSKVLGDVVEKMGRPLVRSDLWEQMAPAEQTMATQLRGLLDDVYKNVVEESASVEALNEAIFRKYKWRMPKNVKGAKRFLKRKVEKEAPELAGRVQWDNVNSWFDLGTVMTHTPYLEREELLRSWNRARSVVEKRLAQQGLIPQIGRKRDNYLPHLMTVTPEEVNEMVKAQMRAHGSSSKAMGAAAPAKLTKQVAGNLQDRKGLMVPDVAMLDDMVQYGLVDEDVLNALKANRRWDATAGVFRDKSGGVAGLRQYTLDPFESVGRYIHGMANTYSWTVKGYGKAILGEMDKLSDWQKMQMKDVYIPMMLGQYTPRQAAKSVAWSETRHKWLMDIENKEGLMGLLPGPAREWFKDRILKSAAGSSWMSASSSVASYFYTTTLGLNPGSALRNTLQYIIGTVPFVGTGAGMNGMKIAGGKVKKYFKLRGQPGITPEDAFKTAFSEFYEAGVDPTPITRQLIKNGLERSYRGSLLAAKGSTRRAVEKAQDVMLSGFQATEMWNRLATFYAGRYKYVRDAVPKGVKVSEKILSEANDFGRELVQVTQFPAGVGESPRVIQEWSPLSRQFLHFPLRFAGMIADSLHTPYRGATGPTYGRFGNWGPIGRLTMGSVAAAKIAENALGADISPGLMTGALPLPTWEGSPFYPLPLVPPVFSLVGSGAMALSEGSTEPLKRTLPLLVPGGVALSRARRSLSPEYVNYQQQGPDGRFPVFTDRGTLKGYYSPVQLAAKAMGLGTIDETKERELMGYLIKQRDILRTYRKDYLEAIYDNDTAKAAEIQEEFQSKYPELGKIYVQKKDLKTIELRKRITRLEKLLDTIPPEYREEYGQLVGYTLAEEAQELLGVDPILLGTAGMTSRTRPRSWSGQPIQAPNINLGSFGQGEQAPTLTQPLQQSDLSAGRAFAGFGGF